MNTRFCKLFRLLVFTILFIMIIQRATFVLRDKTGAGSNISFFAQTSKIDVVFLGTSVTHGGISPLDLWHDYGMVSYNLASPGFSPISSYYVLEEAFEYQIPKLVVLDVSYLVVDGNESYWHRLIDNLPFGSRKLRAIIDIVPYKKWHEYLFPLAYYHERWKLITESDYSIESSDFMGGTVANISRGADGVVFDTSEFLTPPIIVPKEIKEAVPEENLWAFRRIVDLCAKYDVELLFFNAPSYAQGERNHGNGERLQRQWNAFADFAQENGVEYINCMHQIDEMGFSFVDDLRDWRHLSVSGNKKLTSYLGNHIMQHYEIPNRQNEEGLGFLDLDYVKWNEYVTKLMNE